MGPPTLFTIPVLRYMKTYSLTHEQLAMISVCYGVGGMFAASDTIVMSKESNVQRAALRARWPVYSIPPKDFTSGHA